MYTLIRNLSLDVTAGAIITTLALAKLLGVHLHWSIPLSLGICIWSIYTLDHLMDARKQDGPASTQRHRFHQTYQKPLVIFVMLTLGAGLFLIPLLPVNTLVYGGILAGFVCLYFIALTFCKQTIIALKEVVIGLVYAAGVFLGPISQGNGFSAWILPVFVQILLLALINLYFFALQESEIDDREGYGSGVLKIGNEKSLVLLRIFLLVFWAITGWTLLSEISAFQLILAGMGLVLTALVLGKFIPTKNELYRVFGDAVFLLPVLFLV